MLSEVTVDTIAEAMGLTRRQLWHRVQNEDAYYQVVHRVIKGKPRELCIPCPRHKKELRRLHDYLLRCWSPDKAAHGGVRRRSAQTCARKHMGRKVIETRDIERFFPSIKPAALKKALRKLGCRSDVALVLSKLMTFSGEVPLGSPTSTLAANMFLSRIDEKIGRKAKRLKVAYTRHVDDITISGEAREAHVLAEAVERDLTNLNLNINAEKKSENGFQSQAGTQLVLGYRVNSSKGLGANKQLSAKAIQIAHQYVQIAKSAQFHSLSRLTVLRSQLTGHIAHLKLIENGPRRELLRSRALGDRIVLQRLHAVGIFPKKNRWWGGQNTLTATSNGWRKKVSGGDRNNPPVTHSQNPSGCRFGRS